MTTITNVIRNPSVETNTTDWITLSSTFSRSTDQAYSGANAIKCVCSGAGATQGFQVANGQIFAATQGQTWTVAVYLYGASGTVRVELAERTAAGGSIGGASTTQNTTLTPAWTRNVITRTLTSATAAFLGIYVYTPTAQAITFYADAIQLTQTSAAVDYFDGSSPGAVWTGTAHASSSVLTIPDALTIPRLQIGSSYIGPMRVGRS